MNWAQAADDRIALGQRGEQIAMEYLRSRGLVVLDRNWRPRGQGVRAAWLEARYLLDGADASRYDVTAYFMDRLDGDERQLDEAMRLHPSPLVAAVSLGWVPWCPLKSEQDASMRRVLEARRAVLA